MSLYRWTPEQRAYVDKVLMDAEAHYIERYIAERLRLLDQYDHIKFQDEGGL